MDNNPHNMVNGFTDGAVPNADHDMAGIHTATAPGVEELDYHLNDLLDLASPISSGPPHPAAHVLDIELFDQVSFHVTQATVRATAELLLPRIVAVLRHLPEFLGQQPPSQDDIDNAARDVAGLATKLMEMSSFTEAISFATRQGVIDALGPGAPAATSELAMDVIHKAARSSLNMSQLSSDEMTGLLKAFLTCWLASPSVNVGDKGTRVLLGLLTRDILNDDGTPVDVATANGGGVNGAGVGQRGRFWTRLFRDQDIYDELLIPICRGTHPAVEGPRIVPQAGEANAVSAQTTIAQSRLLGILPELAALNMPMVEPLLEFAGLRMIANDRHTDALMHQILVAFYDQLVLETMRAAQRPGAVNPPQYTIDVLRRLLREVRSDDPQIIQRLRELPSRVPEGEKDAAREWLARLLPVPHTRVAGWTPR